MAEGSTSQPYSASSIIGLCRSAAASPPARSWRLANCSYTADSSAPVPHAKSATRNLPMAAASAQSTPLQLGDGDARKQRGGSSGQRVESGEILAVRNQLLEYAVPVRSWELVTPKAFTSPAVNSKLFRMRAGVAGVYLLQQIHCDGEDRPVVDFQDFSPTRPSVSAFGLTTPVAAHLAWVFDALVYAGDYLLEHEGVGEYGARHSASLTRTFGILSRCAILAIAPGALVSISSIMP